MNPIDVSRLTCEFHGGRGKNEFLCSVIPVGSDEPGYLNGDKPSDNLVGIVLVKHPVMSEMVNGAAVYEPVGGEMSCQITNDVFYCE